MKRGRHQVVSGDVDLERGLLDKEVKVVSSSLTRRSGFRVDTEAGISVQKALACRR